MGKLQSMAFTMPGAWGLFSLIQEAFCHPNNSTMCLRLSPAVHCTTQDFWALYGDLADCPTQFWEVTPQAPSLIGSHDASGQGAGSVLATQPGLDPTHDQGNTHYHPRSQPSPLLWWMTFPKLITKQLVSTANPHGSLTNSDLELVGSLLHLDAAALNFDVHEQTLLSKTDNMATLYWQCKGAATTTVALAYLFWLQATNTSCCTTTCQDPKTT